MTYLTHLMKVSRTLIVLGFALAVTGAIAQKPTKVKLIRADNMRYDKRLGDKVQRLIGDVVLKQDSSILYCDSAYLYELTNSFDGFGNVHIKVSDTLNIYSDLLKYYGNEKIAELHHHVRLVDPKATLETEHLWYNRITKIAYYTTGGKIMDKDNELTSVKGYYYTDPKEAYFKDSVILVNPKYIVNTDTMKYETDTEISYFFGPTTITSDSNLIYCEKGWYNTKTDQSLFTRNSYILTDKQKLQGDTLYYDRLRDFGKALHHVSVIDTVQNMLIRGDYGEFKKREGYSFVTGRAEVVMIDRKDSLFLHSDTLWVLFDSTQKINDVLAYHHAKFYRKDLQGICDSLVYDFGDSTIFLYKSPVLWSGKNQLTADTVRIAMANNRIDTLALINSAFIISVDDTVTKKTFNQVKGKVMTGYFKDNQLNRIKLFGNAESVYYIREDDGLLIGINKTTSSDMSIYLADSEVQVITPIKNVDAHMYPPGSLSMEDVILKGFKWLEEKRPLTKEDIFTW